MITALCKTIQSFEAPALKQGWIRDTGVLSSLDQKLNAVMAALQAADKTTAANVLDALVNDVDAQANKGLSPEAVALFKYNAQYLVARLLGRSSPANPRLRLHEGKVLN